MFTEEVAHSHLFGSGIPEADHVRYWTCPTCNGNNCFCVYADHAYCHNEKRYFTRQELEQYIHRHAPWTVTDAYMDDLSGLPASVRQEDTEFTTTWFNKPVFGFLNSGESYVLCYSDDGLLRKIVFAEPHPDWITLHGIEKIDGLPQNTLLLIFENQTAASHVQALCRSLYGDNSPLCVWLPPIPDADRLCSFSGVDFSNISCAVFTGKNVSRALVNKLLDAGVPQVLYAEQDEFKNPPVTWNESHIQSMMQKNDFTTLTKDNRVASVSSKRESKLSKMQSVKQTIKNILRGKILECANGEYLLTQSDTPCISMKSKVIYDFLYKIMNDNNMALQEIVARQLLSWMRVSLPRVRQATDDIGGRYMFFEHKIWINTPDKLLCADADNINLLEKNSVTGIYFPEKDTGEYSLETTSKTVREIIEGIFGADQPNTLGVIAGYMAITPFLAKVAHPIILLSAPEANGKTTLMRFIAETLFPQKFGFSIPLLTGKVIDMVFALNYAGIALLDNVERIGNDAANLLCAAVTNSKMDIRKFMTNTNTVPSNANGLIIITGRKPSIPRTDLMSRILSIHPKKLTAYKDYYTLVGNRIPFLRYALLSVGQKMLKRISAYSCSTVDTRFSIFNNMLQDAIAICGWENAEDIVRNAHKTTNNDTIDNNELLGALLQMQPDYRYSCAELRTFLNDLGVDAGSVVSMAKRISLLQPAISRAGYSLERIRDCATRYYVLIKTEDK